ncbi:MAG TPA: alcohol dehydrogenase catalytic domain-containing protein [Streptosporangiaceae bacterium]
MKAVTVGEPGTVKVVDVPEPRLQDPLDAVVRVTAAAICGADLFPIHGKTPGFDNATVLGHEFVGTVAEVGAAVERVRVGQRVVCSSTVSDGACGHCRAHRPAQCERRSLFGYSGVYPRLDGGQAELVRVPMADRCLLPLPDAMGDEQALFLADILPTGFAAVRNSGADLSDTIVVLGCGPVGLMALLCASGFGGGAIAVDGIAARRELASEFGAVPASPDDAATVVAARTSGMGADVVIEAAGTPQALDAAFRLARGQGTVSVVGAHFEPDYKLDAGLMFERELTLRFSIGDPLSDRERLMRMILDRKLGPERVISHRMELDEAAAAYQLFDQRIATKAVLFP